MNCVFGCMWCVQLTPVQECEKNIVCTKGFHEAVFQFSRITKLYDGQLCRAVGKSIQATQINEYGLSVFILWLRSYRRNEEWGKGILTTWTRSSPYLFQRNILKQMLAYNVHIFRINGYKWINFDCNESAYSTISTIHMLCFIAMKYNNN